MNRNVILLTQFSQVYLLTNSNWNCHYSFWYAFISRISFTWKYMLCEVMNFHFLVIEKSWKINVEKQEAPCTPPRPTRGSGERLRWVRGGAPAEKNEFGPLCKPQKANGKG